MSRNAVTKLVAVTTCAGALGMAVLLVTNVEPAASAPAAHSNCPPYLVIGSRGSGADARKFKGMGEESWAFTQRLSQLLPGVQYHANDYPAAGVFTWSLSIDFLLQLTNAVGAGTKLSGLGIGAYHDSAVDGTSALASLVKQTVASCGDRTQILLTGHSQGAQVTADVYQRELDSAERERVLGVVLFGDPYFNGRDNVARGEHSKDRTGLLGTREPFPPDAQGEVLSYCHEHDPICQGILTKLLGVTIVDPQALTFGQHTNYHEHGEPEEAAEYFARLAGSLAPPPRNPLAPTCITPRRTGVVFVVDDSTSMSEENDVSGLRYDAAVQGLQLLPVGSEAAVVKFSGAAYTAFEGPVDSGIPSRGTLALAGDAAVDHGGGTHYDQGLGQAEGLLASPAFSAPDRLAVVFISDGLPNGGDYTGIRQRIAARGIPIFTIGIGPVSQEGGRDVLEELAAPNGAAAYFIQDASAVNELITVFARIVSTVNCDDPRAIDTTQLPAATIQGFGSSEYPITVEESDAQLIGVVTWTLEGQVRVSLRRPDGSILRLGTERPGERVQRGRVDERFEVSDPVLPPGVWILTVENTSRTDPVRVSLAVFARRLGEPLPTAPKLISPVGSARVSSATVRFRWAPATRAVSYDVLVDGRPLGHIEGATELEIADLEAGTHEWHVRAYNSSGRYVDSRSGLFVVSSLAGRSSSTAPVILIPGIMGSRLYCRDGLEIWPGVSLSDLFLADDGSSPADDSDECNNSVAPRAPELQLTGAGIIERVSVFSAYDGVVEWLGTHSALQAAGSQSAGDPRRAYVFPYDWRKSPGDPATQRALDTFVDEVRRLSSASKVRIVAHSMGGLVAHWYISERALADKVEKLVTVGTPFWGAPTAYAPLLLGETGPDVLVDLDLALRGTDVRKFATTSGGIYSLYPNEDYWSAVNGDGLLELRRLPAGISDLDTIYTQGAVAEVVVGVSATDNALRSWGARTSLIRQARQSSADHISGFLSNGVNVQAVIGAGVRGIAGYRATVVPVDTQYGTIDTRTFEFTWATGDGTVPARSAAQGVWWAPPHGDDVTRRYVCGTKHLELMGFGQPLNAREDRDGGRIAAAVYPFLFGNAGDVLPLEDPDGAECRSVESDVSRYFELPGFSASGP